MATLDRFIAAGKVLRVEPGRRSPGLPSEHVVTAAGLHVSLAFREVLDRPSILFDMPRADMPEIRDGFRVMLDSGEVETFRKKTDYYRARDDAGWPVRKKKRPT